MKIFTLLNNMFLDKVIWHSQQAVNGQILKRRSMDINVEQI